VLLLPLVVLAALAGLYCVVEYRRLRAWHRLAEKTAVALRAIEGDNDE
jgi:hypothetical protein